MKKVLLTGLGPISNKIHSHKAAQAIIYADQLEFAGYDVTINLVNNKIYDYNFMNRYKNKVNITENNEYLIVNEGPTGN